MGSVYSYRGLELSRNEIRLVTIFPGSEADELHCSIMHVPLGGDLSYEALSYSWEDQTLDSTVKEASSPDILFVHDQYTVTLRPSEEIPHLKIKKNLAAYLRARRKTGTGAQLIWIDAISIDQANLQERSVQVLRMGCIYQGAKSVIIWLGPERDNSNLAMEYIILLTDRWRAKRQWLSTDIEWQRESTESGEYTTHWQALHDLLERSWWERLWTIQEVVLARQCVVACGDLTLDWSRFGELYRLVSGIEGLYFNIITKWVLQQRVIHNEEIQLLEIIDLARGYNATDPRDKIYGVLGLAWDANFIVPDYSLPYNQVLQKLVFSIVEYHKSLDILSFAGIGSAMSFVSSWLPDLDIEFRESINPALIPTPIRLVDFKAAQNSFAVSRFTLGVAALNLNGFQVDEIDETVGASFEDERHSPNSQKNFYGSDDEAFTAIWRSTLGGPHRNNSAHTWAYDNNSMGGLFAGLCTILENGFGSIPAPGQLQVDGERHESINSSSTEGQTSLQNWYHSSRNFLFAPRPISEWVQLYKPALHFQQTLFADKVIQDSFWSNFNIVQENRKVMRTKNGLFGMVPNEARRGDLLCVLLGGKMPFILRPQDDYFLFVGECYIHGIMFGEAMEGLKTGEYQLREFELR